MAPKELSPGEMKRRLEQLERENQALKKVQNRFSLKVSDKGGVCVVMGTRRFPITLYPREWETVLEHASEIKKFIADNKDRLSWDRGEKNGVE